MITAARSDTAATIHFSCCRSSPRERRKRNTVDASDAITSAKSEALTTADDASMNDCSCSTPSGLSGQATSSVSSSGPGYTQNASVTNVQDEPEGPDHGSPAWARRPTVGEQQRHDPDRTDRRIPGPEVEPTRDEPEREAAGIEDERAVGVLVRERSERAEQRAREEQPADGVPRLPRRDERADRRESGEGDHQRDVAGEGLPRLGRADRDLVEDDGGA